ncbi:sigma-70 family RNA polymerase sigma factor [Lederbergia wuyishanensis]|uniref:RNA polymerase sigma-70 factor (ECF subfamily) n=1 Tax=Lederbergia wuyishanensis TaxID=1347903 RepID=A0ABU0D843_9BACI|nr:sigma-70 family RNA polymerase sigma factor [Lederbergia wuyishanensis]MCJ8009292.1 sigma-70 family RNA polymerase sigma factor [Lederbergia wuyishanensis]MDQ0344574.1 RNA polymerase sigma-70 factor (ECF subfamily) [Lederbergia wuyishanensis]
MKKAQKGNDKAFLKLFQQYEEDIYRTAYVYVKNQADALDVVQETAYRSFKAIQSLREPKYFKTWLLKIAIRCSLDILRRQKKVVPLKREFEEMLPSQEGEFDIPLSMSLNDLLELLNEEEKNVVVLRYYHDYTIKEVAETLKIPLGTAKTILYRAIKKLRKQWKGDDVGEQ